MTDNTQLPAEVLADIELKAEHEAALQFHPTWSPDQNTACLICYRNGAKEYATKLHEDQQEKAALQAKCERYENCIQDILDYIGECKGSAISLEGRLTAIENTLSKALSVEGERICPNCKKVFNADRNSNCRVCGSDEYANQKEDKQ